MTTEILKNKTSRYLKGEAMPAETRQIQNWLSCTQEIKKADDEEIKNAIENEIMAEVQAYTAYPLFFPKPQAWWRKFVQ